jgi:hypothetical protein
MYTMHYELDNGKNGTRERTEIADLINLLNLRPPHIEVTYAVILDEAGARRWTDTDGFIEDDGKPRHDEDGLRDGNVECRQCLGGGQYITGMDNGIPITAGDCFRCGGKGYTTQADRKRNYGYNFHRKVVA